MTNRNIIGELWEIVPAGGEGKCFQEYSRNRLDVSLPMQESLTFRKPEIPHTEKRWVEIMTSSLDRHFPLGASTDNKTLLTSQLRPRFREFEQEVDEQVRATSSGREILEWEVTTAILRVLVRKMKRLRYGHIANCLNAFGPDSDSFAWAAFRNRPMVREAVGTWCHHLGWRRVYVVLAGDSNRETGTARVGIHLIGLCPTITRDKSNKTESTSYGQEQPAANTAACWHERTTVN